MVTMFYPIKGQRQIKASVIYLNLQNNNKTHKELSFKFLPIYIVFKFNFRDANLMSI